MGRLVIALLLVAALAGGTPACNSGAHGESAGDVALTGDGDAPPRDSVVAAAERALQAGHPWLATRMLAPVLRDSARRTPAAVLLAARAAAGWEGWSEVDRLLRRERWLGTQFAGAGYELLARSALERGQDTVAVTFADSAVRRARDARTRAERFVFLARALDRVNQRDSARVAYERAAGQLADAREWLVLRAAGVTDDSAARARLFAQVRQPTARARIPWTDAQARERSGDAGGAADRYAALGAMPSAFRLRLGLAMDSAAHDALRDSVVRYIRARSGTADARLAVEVLDRAIPSLSPSDELTVARSASVSGPVARAIAGYERGLSAPGAMSTDRRDYGELLIRAARYRDAIAQLEQVRAPAAVAAQAAYQRGRALLLSGNGGGARSALRQTADDFKGDTLGASSALYLLGDLNTDDGKDDDARAVFRELYRAYPTSFRADDARFRAGFISFVHGQPITAALELDSLEALYPHAGEALAALYWSGRAWSDAGDTARARARWRTVIAREPTSYYAGVSARRLHIAGWSAPGGPAGADRFPRVPAVDSAMRRITLLEKLGMDTEARFEYDALEAAALAGAATPDRMLATANALRAHGQTVRSIRIAWRLVEHGQRDARAYRLAYPLIDGAELTRLARARTLDPPLVSGIIRQESSFNPRAVSVAGARGLMQVMPSVGQQLARSLGYPVWDPVLLFDADANLELGTAHLLASMRQYDDLARVLAAYNAGGSRVTRWSDKSGTEDSEAFIERISFTETRDYVRIVLRNADLYRALYSW